ncbi:hypothetical protein KP509_13G010000 [Ceratopteris richardii]|uniref:WD repeat-containing protein 76 n=2 Tax=Ceratopteris richardii TaxID=49495 RepID=A0A8T2TB84_CERRI|nr:hypothetical protein KP509_13G010000 [Ceratopteris richardii]
MATSVSSDDSSADALTEYERQRLENVKRNQALIAALGIQHVKAEIQQQSASKKADHKGYKKSADKRAREREEPIVTRRLRSSRVSWTSEDAEKLGNPPSPEPVKDLFKVEDKRKSLNILSTCVRQSSTENFLERLRNFDDQVPLAQVCTFKRRKREHGDIGPNDLSLHKTDIARVVPGRIMSVAFLPINDFLLVVAGDKFGHLGFWEVESRDEDGDGVNIFQPHSAPVSGVAVQPPGATKVLTCSYDGTVKRLDVEISMFDLMYSLDNDDIFSAICTVPGSTNCAYVAEGSGTLKMLDVREKKFSSSGLFHQRRINTIDISKQSPWLMVTASTDTDVSVWDVRKMKKSRDRIGHVQHKKAVHSAYFSPSGSTIATCSYDNTIALYKVLTNEQPVYIAHPNMNNRWISTFRAIWGWNDRHVFVGNMKRTIDVISTELAAECSWLSSPLMTSIPCRLATHPSRPGVLAGCSAGGQVYVWRK